MYMQIALKPTRHSPQTHLCTLVGYLSRCGPVDCISKVTNLQRTFHEGPAVTLPLPFSPSSKFSSTELSEVKTLLSTRTIYTGGPEGAPSLFRENPELPGNSEVLTRTGEKLSPPESPLWLRTPTSYLAAFALFRNCCPHHLGWNRMF